MSIHEMSAFPAGTSVASRSYAIIGAGAGGLAAAKYLLQIGAKKVTVFEIGSQVGGLWCYKNDNGLSSAYRTLHINTAKNITNFSDLPFDEDVQLFPDHADMQRYFAQYVERFDLRRHIRFNSKVVRIAPANDYRKERPRWEVTTEAGERQSFDRVIVATGHLHKPLEVPEFQGFGGDYLHSHHYREPDGYVGKRVCVVGIGNSAVDIASDVCVTAAKTTIVARSGVMIQPKIMFGVPFTNITMKLYRPWIPARVRQKILQFLVYVAHGDLTRYGFRPVGKRVHTTSNAVFVNHVAYSRIGVRNEITKIDGTRIHFSDGSSDDYDVLVGATGYEIDLSFLAPEVAQARGTELNLYNRIVLPDWPGIYFVGFIQPTTSLPLTFEHQSRWICSLELGNVRLPSPAAMRQAIDDKIDWVNKTFKHTPRHHLEEDHERYFASIASPKAKQVFGHQLQK